LPNNFEGKTFVAYIDISGFKEFMKSKKKAWNALNSLYQHSFDILKDNEELVGIFVSDCGVIYVDNEIMDMKRKLKCLLNAIREINEMVLQDGFMLTCSIAYGEFEYKEKFTFKRMEKSAFQGNAYLNAYLDNEKGNPKIYPGQTRLVIPDNLSSDIEFCDLLNDIESNNQFDEILKFIKKIKKHYYFYWMLNDPLKIDEIDNKYKEIYTSKYDQIRNMLIQ